MKLRGWMKRNREFIIIVLVFCFFLALAFVGYKLGGSSKKDKQGPADTVTELKKTEQGNGQEGGEGDKGKSKGSAKGFYTEISPTEILDRIRAYGDMQALPAGEQPDLLPVGWFVYFFAIDSVEGAVAKVSFDTSETGFGANIICELDLEGYPQFLKMKTGEKVWLQGMLQGVQPEGTGTFYVRPEYFRFDGKKGNFVFPEED
ncbi:hypothetical protein [Desulfotalea psychrophila]|uniref:Uncharacterized protein n=1 Tax=Desulfotalea psychrophila (strain LSv54 / DSM 12343) TaxID=177439 RepID=Q6AJM8_DESPS|nr:hypothetical protein [Desulfotalea psychrophila]CAG37452.1 unknown protein [Desulfotalea psychrophila LSv54]